MDGQTFYEQNLTGALGLVIGSEGFGISRLVKQNCDFTVKMPMIGNVTSLNASVAAEFYYTRYLNKDQVISKLMRRNKKDYLIVDGFIIL